MDLSPGLRVVSATGLGQWELTMTVMTSYIACNMAVKLVAFVNIYASFTLMYLRSILGPCGHVFSVKQTMI